MLFVRSLRPDRLSSCISTFIVNYLGPKFTEPPVLDMQVVFEDSTTRMPLIFVLAPGVDPTSSLVNLAETNNMMSHFYSLSLGQGQAPVAARSDKSYCFYFLCIVRSVAATGTVDRALLIRSSVY